MNWAGQYYRDLWDDLQDPEFRVAYLQACEELDFNPDLGQIERLARGQGWTDE